MNPKTLARKSDQETSKKAAKRASVSNICMMRRARLLSLIKRKGPMNAVELSTRANIDYHEVYRRMSDLKNIGLVKAIRLHGEDRCKWGLA